jgi:hypothetical protein
MSGEYFSEIAFELMKENQEKKRIGRNIFHRTASRKGGVKGAVRLPNDNKQPASCKKDIESCDVCDERKFCTKNGGIKTTMLNMVLGLTWQDFLKLDKEQRKEKLPKMVEVVGGRKALAERLGISYDSIAQMYKQLGLTNPRPKKTKEEKPMSVIKASEVTMVKESPTVAEPKKNTFRLSLSGDYKGEEVKEKLQNFGLILDDGKSYNVYLTIEEGE